MRRRWAVGALLLLALSGGALAHLQARPGAATAARASQRRIGGLAADPDAGTRAGASDAAAFYRLQRLRPGMRDVPTRRLLAAMRQAQRLPSYSSASGRHGAPGAGPSTVLPAWEALGPGNAGGRTLALQIDPHHPNVLFAGAASGGV